jgi:3-methyl-2-oxobutanoate hydroxymethyltransferase
MSNQRVTAPDLIAMKTRLEKISVLTAYDYPMGRLVDEAGIDVALVGDSLGMVVLGYDTTLQVTMEDMISHTAAVSRGAKRALIVADMPFMSFQPSDDDALRNAGRLLAEGGAQAIKLEGGARAAACVRRMVSAGVPVMGHIGMTPQSIHQFGGHKTQGSNDAQAQVILSDAQALQDAGVFSIVLEKIPSDLAQQVTESLDIPTIGIGAGPHCDGQVLVSHDVLGYYDKFTPPFAKQYANLWNIVLEAFQRYKDEVKSGTFPTS